LITVNDVNQLLNKQMHTAVIAVMELPLKICRFMHSISPTFP